MSTPIKMVRKIKKKIGEALEQKPIKLIVPEDLKSVLARTITSSQGPIFINKSRSSSNLKNPLSLKPSQNITPLRKMRNLSYYMGSTPDISEFPSTTPLNDDSKQRILANMEETLLELKKNGKKEEFFEIMKKISLYDPCLKRIVEDSFSGIVKSDWEERERLKKELEDVTQERNKLKKDLERCKKVFKFMKKKKEVPVEKYFQEFNEMEKVVEKMKREGVRKKSIPMLDVTTNGETGFHQEFMSRINEFSDSWRALIRTEKNL